MKNICPVCGYDALYEAPYDIGNGNPSHESCMCCGYEFGYHDGDQGISFEKYRMKWIENGAKWVEPTKKPSNWELEVQLKNIDSLPYKEYFV